MTQDQDAVEGEIMEESAIVIHDGSAALMPAMSVEDALARRDAMNEVVSSIMIEGKDYGTIPGTAKPTLYKPGAEKLTTFFGLTVIFEDIKSIEQWDSEEPFFYYRQKCKLYKGDLLIAEASGSVNSREDRYRWRWTKNSPDKPDKFEQRISSIGHFRWQIDQAETTGKYAKPNEYWAMFHEAIRNKTANIYEKEQHWNKEVAEYVEIETIEWRLPNPDVFSLVNTILKMAQKRALVAATLIACDASEFFTQDLEDGIASEEQSGTPSVERDARAGNAMINWPLDEIVKHAKALAVNQDSKDADMANTYWTLGRALEVDEQALGAIVQDATEDGKIHWPTALEAVIGLMGDR